MKVAVTGAQGYLGRALVERLAADDRIEQVCAIDARPAASTNGSVSALRRDVRDPAVRADLEGVDALIHLAFVVLGLGTDAQSINVEGSRNVFAAALDAGVGTIVHASSAAAYGSSSQNPVPLTEDHPLRPLPPFYYPQTKVEVEAMLEQLERAHPQARFVRMRPVSTLGPGAPRLAPRGTFVTLSDFDPLMQFTWIDDVAAAFEAALHDPHARGAYNVGAPGPVRASLVAALIGVRSVRLPHRLLRPVSAARAALRLRGALHPGWVDTARYPIVVDTSRIERELGWRATHDCAEALQRYGREVL